MAVAPGLFVLLTLVACVVAPMLAAIYLALALRRR